MELLFQRGRFGAESAASTASAVRIWAVASPFLVLALYGEEAVTAHGRAGWVAAERGLAVVVMGLACWWGPTTAASSA